MRMVDNSFREIQQKKAEIYSAIPLNGLFQKYTGDNCLKMYYNIITISLKALKIVPL